MVSKKALYMRKYLQTHPDQKAKSDIRWKLNKTKLVQRNTELTNRLKATSCTDCRIQYSPWIMHFDHRNPANKSYSVSRMVRNCMSEQKILEEIEKCEVVCANCHAERTHRQRENGEI